MINFFKSLFKPQNNFGEALWAMRPKGWEKWAKKNITGYNK